MVIRASDFPSIRLPIPCVSEVAVSSSRLAVRKLCLNFQPYRQYQNGYTELLGWLAGTREQGCRLPMYSGMASRAERDQVLL
jgi:hypothetical protein